MNTYVVIVTGTSTERYEVEADSEAEAREKWSDVEPFQSEVDNCSVVGVERA